MTLIKSEPTNDLDLTLTSGYTGVATSSKESVNKVVETNSDSRQALGTKKINVGTGKKDTNKELKKHPFEEFFLSPGRVGVGSLESIEKKSRPSVEKPLIKKEPQASGSLFHDTEAGGKRQHSPVEKPNIDTKKQKQNPEEASKKEISGNNSLNHELGSKQLLENPGTYIPMKKLLYDSNNDYSESSGERLFQDLEQESERKYCCEASKWPLAEWIDQGQTLLQEHTKLVGQLVQQRVELSQKFQAITTIINERAEALKNQGEIVEEKMTKIENLGKEILDII